MDLKNSTSFVALPKENWEALQRDLYNISRKLDTLETGKPAQSEWRPFSQFLETTTWGKTLFYDKKKSKKFPENLFLKRGRKVFIHASAWDRFFAGDFD